MLYISSSLLLIPASISGSPDCFSIALERSPSLILGEVHFNAHFTERVCYIGIGFIAFCIAGMVFLLRCRRIRKASKARSRRNSRFSFAPGGISGKFIFAPLAWFVNGSDFHEAFLTVFLRMRYFNINRSELDLRKWYCIELFVGI